MLFVLPAKQQGRTESSIVTKLTEDNHHHHQDLEVSAMNFESFWLLDEGEIW